MGTGTFLDRGVGKDIVGFSQIVHTKFRCRIGITAAATGMASPASGTAARSSQT